MEKEKIATNVMDGFYKKILLYRHDLEIFLVNKSDIDILSLQFSTYTKLIVDDEEGIMLVSSRPYYIIEDIPAHTYMELEKLDPFEDGVLSYVFEKIMWADGTLEEDVYNVHIRKLSKFMITSSDEWKGMEKIIREKRFIKSDEGFEKRLR